MAAVTKRTDPAPSLASQTPTPENQIDGVAGEAIDYADACYLASDGTIKKCQWGVAGKEVCHGFAANKQVSGKPITIYKRAAFGYTLETGSTAVTPGVPLYLSTTVAGGLNTTPGSVGAPVVAMGDRYGVIHVDGAVG